VSARREAKLWALQRLTAAILALCVCVHLATIIYAVRGGLGAAEILGRTRGSVGWALFYATFVVAAALHGGIGVRTIAIEWLGLRGAAAQLVAGAIAFALAALGLRAVAAVVTAP
jgi:fumarate reductase subunit C